MEGAVFRTEKDNARETDPTNSNNIVPAGNQLVKGAQFSVVGRLPQGMDLVAGYAYLDSEVLASQIFPTSIGYPLANVPKQTFNIFVTHRLPWRLNGGLGGNYVGSRTASSTVPYVPTGFAAQSEWARICRDQRGDETGAGILDIQCDVEASSDREAGAASQRQ